MQQFLGGYHNQDLAKDPIHHHLRSATLKLKKFKVDRKSIIVIGFKQCQFKQLKDKKFKNLAIFLNLKHRIINRL